MSSPEPARRDGDRPFIISRTYAAPRARVWAAWTDADQLKRWFGPAGSSMPTCAMDLRPGGVFHYSMRMPGAPEMWGKWTFMEIAAPARLVLVSSFSDAQGGLGRHPMAPTWPQETLSTTTLSERDGGTTMEIRWLVRNGTEVEHQTFDGAHDGMRQGWGGTLDQLAAHLAKG
jgi:uncharacterized protein YndB with AHSA1/START domain